MKHSKKDQSIIDRLEKEVVAYLSNNSGRCSQNVLCSHFDRDRSGNIHVALRNLEQVECIKRDDHDWVLQKN